MAELKQIPIEKLQPHPDNPRLVLREDVIEGIVAQLKESSVFSEMHAPIVRPVNGHYQIISGHTRHESAKRAQIKIVPCWVEEMTDKEAHMQLVLSNAQGELNALEIGIHAFKAVPPEKGGRGKKGGLSEYADRIGKKQPNVSRYRNAGEVFEAIRNIYNDIWVFGDKAHHLAAIHALPSKTWPDAVAHILKKKKVKGASGKEIEREISAAEVEDSVKAANEALEGVPANLPMYTPETVALKVFTGELSRKAVQDCVTRMLDYLSKVRELNEEKRLRSGAETVEGEIVTGDLQVDSYFAPFDEIISTNDKDEGWPEWIWDVMKIEARTDATNKELQALKASKATVHEEDALSFLRGVEDESVDLLITDPPYATDIDNIAVFAAEWVPLAIQKLKPTGRAYICTGAYPEELAAYAATLTAIDGLTVGVPLVWGYENTIGPAPKRDYKTNIQMIWHAYKADAPDLNTSVLKEKNTLQVISAPDGRTGERWHAWEKPLELASMLVRHALSQAGAFVVDPFAGTGTFLLAAIQQGHIAVGSEINPDMIAIQKERGVANG